MPGDGNQSFFYFFIFFIFRFSITVYKNYGHVTKQNFQVLTYFNPLLRISKLMLPVTIC